MSPAQPEIKRFTVSLDREDYERLRELAEVHRPQFTLQYLVRYAVQGLLQQAEDPQFMFGFADPSRPRG